MDHTKRQPKRKILQNIWGNWNGYEGSRKVKEFGTDGIGATLWLSGSCSTPDIQFSESGALLLGRGSLC